MGLLTEQDLYLFNEGRNYRAYEKLGAHLTSNRRPIGRKLQRVGSECARRYRVIGSFNGWNPRSHPLRARESSGIWEGFIPGVTKGSIYKFHIVSQSSRTRGRQGGPIRIIARKTATNRLRSVGSRIPVDRSRLDEKSAGEEFPASPDFHLRSPSRFMDAAKSTIAR